MQSQSTLALPGRKLTASILLLASLTIMANATIAPALPGMKAHFADVAGIDTLAGLILSLPSIAIVLTAGVFGWLADRVDRQKLLGFAAVLYAAGGASGLWAETLPQILVGRIILGVGVAGTMTLGMAWAADLWQGPARAKFLGLQGAAMSIGGIVVILLGGALATLSWRGAFAVYLLVLPVAAFALMMLAPHAKRMKAARVETASRPSVAVEQFPWLAFALVGPLAFVFMATFYVIPTRLPFFLDDLGVSNTLIIGAIMASMTVASVPGALLYGQIRKRMSPIAIFAFSYVLMGVGMLIISSATATGAWTVVAGCIVAGIGMGPSMPNYTTYFMAFVPPTLRGRASGLLTTAFFAGQFASPLVSAPLVASVGLPDTFLAFGIGLIVLGGTVAVSGYWKSRAALL